MKKLEVEKVLSGIGLIEYYGDWYEYTGDDGGKHCFSDINDGYQITISDRALYNSTEFYYTERF